MTSEFAIRSRDLTPNQVDNSHREMSRPRASPWPGAPTHHEKVLLELFGAFPKGSLLDAPCGKGQMSIWLREMGYDVHCFDIDPDLFQGESFPFQEGDLNGSLPYEDSRFDTILCKRGVQRISGLDGMLSEFRRVLKPGGTLVVSAPNYARIQRRLRFLVFGSVSKNINSQECRGWVESSTANFRNFLLYPQLEKTLQRQGLRIERVFSDGRPYAEFHLLPFVLLAKFSSLFASENKKSGYSLRGANSAHALAGGRHLIFVCKRMRA